MLNKIKLSGNALKIIACVSMLIDHAGLMLFPNVLWMRCVGRLAFPIFAFLISEGCRYTKNKLKYFLSVFLLGAVCQVAYQVAYPDEQYLGILITFSISILLIYALQFAKSTLIGNKKAYIKALSAVLFVCAVAGAYVFCLFFEVDYGFMGCVLPLFGALVDFKGVKGLEKVDIPAVRTACFSIGVLVYYLQSALKFLTVYSLFSILLLLLYSGKRGSKKLKYLFYAFYPLHLLVLAGLQLVI